LQAWQAANPNCKSKLFHKYGEKIVFVGRLLPAVRTYVSLPAGIGRTNFFKFATYTLAAILAA
jgi:membrane protein DedA with SNARE-associated domain